MAATSAMLDEVERGFAPIGGYAIAVAPSRRARGIDIRDVDVGESGILLGTGASRRSRSSARSGTPSRSDGPRVAGRFLATRIARASLSRDSGILLTGIGARRPRVDARLAS